MRRFSDDVLANRHARSKLRVHAIRQDLVVRGGASLLVLLALAALPAGCDRADDEGVGTPAPAPTIEVDDATYQDTVAAFYTGVTAIHVGDNETALSSFTRTTELVPDEAAGWANLALTQLRLGTPEPAAAALAEAVRLAPSDSRIAHLAAISALRSGDRETGDVELRRAIEIDGGNLRARYALFEELRRSDDAATSAQAREMLRAIIEAQPENIVALIDLALLDSDDGVGEDLGQTLERLASQSAAWPETARAELEQARTAAAAGDARATSIALIGMNNLLLDSPAYQQGLAALKSPPTAVGEPLNAFVSLPTPSARPAEADMELQFRAIPAPAPDGTRWMRAISGGAERPAILVIGAADGIRIFGGAPDGGDKTIASIPSDAPPLDPSEVPASGVAFLDAYNDGILDVVTAGPGGLRIWSVDDSGGWSDITASTALPSEVIEGDYSGVWAFDTELDGDLDLLLGSPSAAPTLLRNLGDGTWAVESPLPDVRGVTSAVWADVDGDGDPDLAVIDGESRLQVLTNERSDRYISVPLGTAAEGARALAVADADLDGVLDLIVLRADGAVERVAFDGTGAAPAWTVDELARAAAPLGQGSDDAVVLFADLDNNGAPDLVVSVDGATTIWLAGSEGGLAELSSAEAGSAGVSSAVDLDGDGRLDLVGAADGAPLFLGNGGGAMAYHWLAIQPEAILTGDQRNNTFGVGGEIDLRAGLLYQKRPIDGPVIHFGLGEHEAANVVRIRWPNGSAQGEFDLADASIITAGQRLIGSCPWLFAWNGSEMAFVTDVLWRSPLGLRINAQVTAGVVMTRDWVKVGGDRLQPRDGRLETAVTAELWETHFFDEFGMIALDHPEGTEVWVDERFSIPPPPLEVRVTGPVSPPDRVVDGEGRDVTAAAAEMDGVYVDTFELGRYQGVTDEHSVEIVVGEVRATASGTGAVRTESSEDGPLILIAQGWIRPTDSSINVALSQGSHAPPRGLRLEVADQAAPDGWRELHPDLGFPAGKSKTMLIDLAGAWPDGFDGERRLRLSTNMEIYWDRLSFAFGRPSSDVVRVDIPVETAELRHRGFSYTTHLTPRGVEPAPVTQPEIPDYERIASTAPIWLDLEGFHTRYGDVLELVAATDDRYVIANAGDEVRLSFAAPPAPKAGMVRDYIFVTDGWEKDGNFNTAYSKTVHPLPSHDRPEYVDQAVYGDAGSFRDDPIYQRFREDWLVYHTRWVSPRDFVRALVVE